MAAATASVTAAPQVRLVACMIVRNEEATLPRCLAAAAPLLDAACIVDTGSADGTQRATVAAAAAAGLPLAWRTEAWTDDFGAARTAAFKACRAWVTDELRWPLQNTYAVLLDADHVLEFGADALQDGVYERCSEASVRGAVGGACCGLVRQRLASDGSTTWNMRLLQLSEPWECLGTTHECWRCARHGAEGGQVQVPPTVLQINDVADGGHKACKYERDARLLETALAATPTCTRSAYYLAQTRFGAGDWSGTIDAVERRLALEPTAAWNGPQSHEALAARLMQADALISCGRSEEALAALLAAHEARPMRVEPLHRAAIVCIELRLWRRAAALAAEGLALLGTLAAQGGSRDTFIVADDATLRADLVAVTLLVEAVLGNGKPNNIERELAETECLLYTDIVARRQAHFLLPALGACAQRLQYTSVQPLVPLAADAASGWHVAMASLMPSGSLPSAWRSALEPLQPADAAAAVYAGLLLRRHIASAADGPCYRMVLAAVPLPLGAADARAPRAPCEQTAMPVASDLPDGVTLGAHSYMCAHPMQPDLVQFATATSTASGTGTMVGGRVRLAQRTCGTETQLASLPLLPIGAAEQLSWLPFMYEDHVHCLVSLHPFVVGRQIDGMLTAITFEERPQLAGWLPAAPPFLLDGRLVAVATCRTAAVREPGRHVTIHCFVELDEPTLALRAVGAAFQLGTHAEERITSATHWPRENDTLALAVERGADTPACIVGVPKAAVIASLTFDGASSFHAR